MATDPDDSEPDPGPAQHPRYVSRADLARPRPPGAWIPLAVILVFVAAVVAWLIEVGTGDWITF